MKKNRLAWLVLFLVFIAATGNLLAAIPGLINFQGRLLDQNKNPKSGTFSITFSIWDTGPGTGGASLWSETQPNIQVTNGMFSAQLGSVSELSASLFSADTLWLQIQVGSEILSPRERLVASPYAFKASVADNVASQAITDTQVNNSAGISWSKISKTGSSLANLETKSASDLTGTLSVDRLTGNYLNDVKVSSAIYSDNSNSAVSAANAATADTANGLATGNYLNDIKVSTALAVAANGVLTGILGTDVICSSAAINTAGSEQIRDGSITAGDVAIGTFISSGTGTVSTLHILDGTILDTDINANAAISDTKLAQLTTSNKVATSAIADGTLGSGVIASSVAINTIGLQQLNATGTKNSYTFYSGNNTWAIPDGNTDWKYQDGAVGETMPRYMTNTNVAVLTSGTLHLTAITLYANTTVTSISYRSVTTAAVTPTNWWFALYDKNRNLLGSTANQTSTAWAANTLKTLALSSAYNVTTTDQYYVGIMMTAATVVSLAGIVSSADWNGLTPILTGNSSTGLSTTPPNPAAALTAGINVPKVLLR